MAKNLDGQEIGRYHVVEQLGQGGMATVYKAYDTRLERHVAIKVIRAGQEVDQKFIKRFEREAKSLAKLQHPNIVGVIDYGEHAGQPYLVMEYLPGGTLKQLKKAPMPYREAARLLAPVAGALAYAHQNGIIHRDIKPANILLTSGGQPMLSDFGIAKLLESEETLENLTGSSMGIGTPEYMSPEQWLGKSEKRTDVYALGVVFYELVTAHRPFSADTPAAVLLKVMSDPLPRPRQYIPDLPEEVENAIFKALARQPQDRYASMADFAAALEKLAQGVPSGQSAARPAPAAPVVEATHVVDRVSETLKSIEPPPPPQKSRRGWIELLGWLAVLAAAVYAVYTLNGRPSVDFISLSPTEKTGVAQLSLPTVSALLAEVSGTVAPPALTPTPTLTPAPTATIDADPAVYDNFNNPQFDRDINWTRWNLNLAPPGEIYQEGGKLVIANKGEPQHQDEVVAVQYSGFRITRPMYFQGDLLLAAKSASGGSIAFGLVAENGVWFTNCQIYFNAKQNPGPMANCWGTTWPRAAGHEYSTQAVKVAFNQWHTFRIEVDPAEMLFTYYMDGTRISKVKPVDAAMLKDKPFDLKIHIYKELSGDVTGQVDNVKVGD